MEMYLKVLCIYIIQYINSIKNKDNEILNKEKVLFAIEAYNTLSDTNTDLQKLEITFPINKFQL